MHCYYKNIYGTRPITCELRNDLVWLGCGFDRPPLRDAVDRFLTDLGHVVEDVFARLVEQAATRGLLNMTYRIDSTDMEALPWSDDASWNYDPTAEEYYYRFGCTVVTTGPKIPIAAEFTDARRAKRVTRSPSSSRSGWWAMEPTTYSTGTTTC